MTAYAESGPGGILLPVPDASEVREAVMSVYNRRILKSRDYLEKISKKLARQPACSYEFNPDFIVMMVHPADDRKIFEKYLKNYATHFPALFSNNGNPVGIFPYIGGLKIEHMGPVTIKGPPNFTSSIQTSCMFDIRRDGRVCVEGIKLKSDKSYNPQVEYNIHLCFIIGFGSKLKNYFIESVLDDFVVSCLTKNAASRAA